MQTKTKRKRLSRGGRWTEEERLQLVRLRDRNKHLAWDQFQKVSLVFFLVVQVPWACGCWGC